MKKNKGELFYLTKMAQGVGLSLIILAIFFAYNRDVIVGQMLLYETMPNYEIDTSIKMLFKFDAALPQEQYAVAEPHTLENGGIQQTFSVVGANPVDKIETEETNGTDMIDRIEDLAVVQEGNILGLEDVIYQEETEWQDVTNHFHDEILTAANVDKLRDFEYLRSKFYIVDKRTGMTEEDFNVDEFLDADLTLSDGDGPKILIFHTHSTEVYSDSKDQSEGVVGLGQRLSEILYNKYDIESLHDSRSYDVVDGKSHILGAYERMEPNIQKLLNENPSIELVIDLHRDGVPDTTRLVTEINGKPTAQLMFFNGLSKIIKDGVLQDIASLPNPNLKSNLALSFQMQLAANTLYPGFTRKVYLNAYRYSLHMMPKSMLVEVGAQTNTKEEAFNAMEPLADILAAVVY